MTAFHTRLLAALSLAAITAPVAVLANPAGVNGAFVLASDTSAISATVSTAATSGACARVSGSASAWGTGVSIGSVLGWYCPATRRMGFQIVNGGTTLESFSGSLSSNGGMFAGTVQIYGTGPRGEYNLVGIPLIFGAAR